MRRILLVLATLGVSASAARATPIDQILDNMQQFGFNYFWNEANTTNGMIKDRMTGNYCSIAAVGFGLSAICIGIDHGWITRAQGATRVQTTLNTFWTLPQGTATTGTIGYKGFFYHFLHMSDGLRDGTTELSDIDTALLLAGILDCKQYFDGSDPTEVSIRALADQIYQRVDWSFFQNTSQNGLMIQWTPESGFNTGVWKGYNEMMIMYLLAMGYPAHGAPGPGTFDNGTIGPTAVFGSLPFAADICLPTIQNIFDSYPSLWGTYGLKDAFNLSRSPDWYDNDFLGIDEGPIVMMIENYRTASVWSRFMQNADVLNGMNAAGFVSLVGVDESTPPQPAVVQLRSGPNPFRTQTQIGFEIARPGRVRLTVHDVTGREVARLLDGWLEAGHHSAIFRADHLGSGVYWYHLDTGDIQTRSRGVLMR